MVMPRLKATKLFKAMLGSRFGLRKNPFFLSHLVTARCNCGCASCFWRNNVDQEMDTEENESLYREAAACGFISNVIWGGEPLMREDLPRLCRTSMNNGMITAVITNGYYLPDLFEQLCPELDSVIVSLDYADAERHDAYRGCPGLFERAVKGIELIRSHYPQVKIFINCLLHRDNEQEAKEVVYLAKDLDTSLYLSPAMEGELPGEAGKTNLDSLASKEGIRNAAHSFLALKRKGYPVNNCRRYLKEYLLEGGGYRCRVPLVFFNVLADGTVLKCFAPGSDLGNVRENSLRTIISSLDRRDLLNLGNRCQKCIVPDVVETSYVWELSPGPAFNTFRVMVFQ